MLRYYVDTEFYEDGKTIDLISIGVVCSDGREFYRVSREADYTRIAVESPWLVANVIPRLPSDVWVPDDTPRIEYLGQALAPYKSAWATRAEIASDLLDFVVGDPKLQFWGYYCLAPATKVLTADLRWVAIADVREGDVLAGFDEHGSRGAGRSSQWRGWRSSVVESVETIYSPCADLTFEDGARLRCSLDHRWLTNSGKEAVSWKTTARLVPSKSKIVKPLDLWQTDLSHAGGYLAAAFDGEGWLTQTDLSKKNVRGRFRFQAGFSQKPNEMRDLVLRLLADSGYTVSATRKHPTSGVYSMVLCSRDEVFRFLGTIRPVRLLPKLSMDRCGAMSLRGVVLKSKEDVGVREVVSLKTSTGTFIAEGFASHNCDYDWVVLCQLYGTMMGLPKHFPRFCMDLKQLSVSLGSPQHPKQTGTEHDALQDARFNRDLHEFLLEVRKSGR